MRIRLLTVSNRQPDWVVAGYEEYAKRLRRPLVLELVEIPLAKRRGAGTAARQVADEGRRLLRQVAQDAHVVALDERGSAWSTHELGERLGGWLRRRAPLCLLVGGPDGLAPECLSRADERWSVSALTLPHGLVRVVVAEALYRAHSLDLGHPYHRG